MSRRTDTIFGMFFATYIGVVRKRGYKMKTQIILASHGKFASGILNSLELICGSNEFIKTVDCYLDESFDLNKVVKDIMNNYKNYELIVITDLFGGSVNNEFLQYIKQPNFYLIAGLNLPFLIELVNRIEHNIDLFSLIHQSLSNAKASIQFCNDSYQKNLEEEYF